MLWYQEQVISASASARLKFMREMESVMLVGMPALLMFLEWDIIKAYRRGDCCIHSIYLVLSVLTIPIVGYEIVFDFGQSEENETGMKWAVCSFPLEEFS
ncbi:hypothetical protein SUGI_1106830 [Cryptomeria japonica]|nr:hypothetical protein SUGI_1106830 [Cryptomeria japonica]